MITKEELKNQFQNLLGSSSYKDAVKSAKEVLPAVVLIHLFDDSVEDDGLIYSAALSDETPHNHYVINGAIVHNEGYVVTTCDTLRANNRIIVSINSEAKSNEKNTKMIITKEDFEGRVIQKIPELNIAIIKIDSKDGEKFKHINLANTGRMKNNSKLIMHKCSFIIGKALGKSFFAPKNIAVNKNSFRVISCPIEYIVWEKLDGIPFLIAVNKLLQSGVFCENAGGVLVDYNGYMLGLVDYKATEKNMFLKNVIIPSDVVGKALMLAIPSLRKKQTELGITYSVKEAKGLVIDSVVKDSPADKAGILPEDVIIQFNGEAVFNSDELKNMLNRAIGDRSMVFTLSRGKSRAEIEVIIN